MKLLTAFLFMLSFSTTTVVACQTSSPGDLMSCFVEAFNSRAADAFAGLLAADYTEAYVSEPQTMRSDKAQAIEHFNRFTDVIARCELTLDGDIEIAEIETGVFEISGIHSTLLVTVKAMDVGDPGEYTLENWATWIVRETKDGLRIVRADYWIYDPNAN